MIYTLELNKIYNINCLVGMTKIADESIDMIFVDLPYGATAENKWDNVIPYKPLWEQFERIIKPNGAILLFGQDKFTARTMLSNEKLHRYNIIWQKTTPTGFLNANRMPLRSHEDIMVFNTDIECPTHEDIMIFYKSLPTYNPQKTTGHKRKVSKAEHKINCEVTKDYGKHKLTSYDSTERFPTSVWTFATDKQKSAIHPTQKPVDLCRYAIRTYTNEGDIVLDCCCGSGSIPLAAKLEGRKYIGMDNGICEKENSEYFGMSWADVATDRIEKYKE